MKIIIVSLLTCSLVFPSFVGASGVPTVDVAAMIQDIKNQIVRVKEFKDKIKEARNRLQKMKDTADHYKDMVDGHFDFETILNAPLLNEHLALDDWRDIYDDVGDLSDLRDEFDLNTDDPDMAIRYDNSLHQIAVQRKILRHVS